MMDCSEINPQHRAAAEATDLAIIALDGLIAAIDLANDQVEYADHQSPAAKALHTTLGLAQEKIAELWELRSAEWKAIVGK